MTLKMSAMEALQKTTPAGVAGRSILYPKADGLWYTRNGTAAEAPLGGPPFTANRIGVRGPSTDQPLFGGLYNTIGNMSVVYSSGDMFWDSSFAANFLTIPTAGVYTFTLSVFYYPDTARRITALETWTGTAPSNGAGRRFCMDDRYLGGYGSATIRATEPMVAGQFVRPVTYIDAGTPGYLHSFMPARFDVRRIL